MKKSIKITGMLAIASFLFVNISLNGKSEKESSKSLSVMQLNKAQAWEYNTETGFWEDEDDDETDPYLMGHIVCGEECVYGGSECEP